MPQSLVKNYIHIVFSTKLRQHLIIPEFEGEMYKYLGGICRNLECVPVIVGGHVNHVHILCLLSKKISVMNLLKELKSNSSKWFKSKDVRLHEFYWQDGYGTFSVDAKGIDGLTTYIANQHKHHKTKSYEEEYRSLLTEHGIQYDERYIWD